MSKRTYGQYCGLARGLDVLGERWTFLIVRELMLGARRYSELERALDGIGTNLLAERLKSLQASGVIERDGDSRRGAYVLTEVGRELEPAVLSLARWGVLHFGAPQPGEDVSGEWAVLGIRALIDDERTEGMRDRFLFDIEGQQSHLVLDDGSVQAAVGPIEDWDVRITADGPTLMAVGARVRAVDEAISSGDMRVEGDLSRLGDLAVAMGWQQTAAPV